MPKNPDSMQAVERNPYVGAFADLMAATFSPERTQQAQGVARFMSAPAIASTLDKMSYGDALVTGRGQTLQLKPDVAEAALAVAPFISPAARLGGRALQAGARELAPQAGRMADQYMNRMGMQLNAAPPSNVLASRVAAPQEQALATARANAVKVGQSPVEQTRMLQQGYEPDWFHGSTGDITAFQRNFLGESTGAESAKKAFFFARDPQNPPANLMVREPASGESVKMLQEMGIPDEEIAKLNQVSMAGHGAETASGYSALGGSRTYKEAMRKASAAEKAGKWDDHEKWMSIAEDAAIGSNQELQGLVAKYGDARDVMLERINNAVLSKSLPQAEAAALDARMKQLMPYGWYNSYSIPQLKALKKDVEKLTGSNAGVSKSIDDFISVKANRQFAETYAEGSNVLPVALRYKNPMVHDFAGISYRDQSYSDLIDQARRGGHDALLLKNTYDPGAGPARLIDVAAVFDPAQVRSRFAAFDPMLKNSPNLLAGAAGMGMVSPLLLEGDGSDKNMLRASKKNEKKSK